MAPLSVDWQSRYAKIFVWKWDAFLAGFLRKVSFFACKRKERNFCKKINHSSCYREGKHFRLTALNDGMTVVAVSFSLFEILNELWTLYETFLTTTWHICKKIEINDACKHKYKVNVLTLAFVQYLIFRLCCVFRRDPGNISGFFAQHVFFHFSTFCIFLLLNWRGLCKGKKK